MAFTHLSIQIEMMMLNSHQLLMDGFSFFFFLYGLPPHPLRRVPPHYSFLLLPITEYKKKKTPLNISLSVSFGNSQASKYMIVCVCVHREHALCSLSRKQCRFLCLNIFLFFIRRDLMIFRFFSFFFPFPPFVFHSTKCNIYTHMEQFNMRHCNSWLAIKPAVHLFSPFYYFHFFFFCLI